MFTTKAIENVQSKGRGLQFRRSSDNFNIVSNLDAAPIQPPPPNNDPVDVLGQPVRSIPAPVVSPRHSGKAHAPVSYAATGDMKQVSPTNAEPKEYNPITNEELGPVKPAPRVQKGSFTKEVDASNKISKDVDPITLEKYHAPVALQGVPPQKEAPLQGIFAKFERIDSTSIKCPKCAQPIYTDGSLAYKGAYIEKQSIYNTNKAHAKCFAHAGPLNADPMKHKPEFVRWTCCLATLHSGGCQLRN